jgi:acyl-CoA reductase-like NAD-dependent aldehyde dehydrogenase
MPSHTFSNARPHPLALYAFTKDESVQDEIFSKTRSGAAVANDLIIHFTNPHLPFGGVGYSGLGAYHGKLTFDTFTHKRAVVKATAHAILDLPVKYPPYTPTKVDLSRRFLTLI